MDSQGQLDILVTFTRRLRERSLRGKKASRLRRRFPVRTTARLLIYVAAPFLRSSGWPKLKLFSSSQSGMPIPPEAAHPFRDDLAHHSEMMWPTIPGRCRPGVRCLC
jgi:hypothetical protein